MVVRGVDVTTSRRRRFAAQRPGLRTSDPAHFGAGRLEGAAPQPPPGQASPKKHQHEPENQEAVHSLETAPDHQPPAFESRPPPPPKPPPPPPPKPSTENNKKQP